MYLHAALYSLSSQAVVAHLEEGEESGRKVRRRQRQKDVEEREVLFLVESLLISLPMDRVYHHLCVKSLSSVIANRDVDLQLSFGMLRVWELGPRWPLARLWSLLAGEFLVTNLVRTARSQTLSGRR